MKIAAAQIRSQKGNISKNVERHLQFIQQAADYKVDVLLFPELSITGYEPALAKSLAISNNDSRLDVFQRFADKEKMLIGIGLPTIADTGIRISMIFFAPNQVRQTYSKQILHKDECPFFVPGHQPLLLEYKNAKLAPAICYESFLPEHVEVAKMSGADVYLSSVSKHAKGIEEANSYFSKLSKKESFTIVMTNIIGPTDNFIAAGNSAIWNNKGILKGQLSDQEEGLLIYDLHSDSIIEVPLNSKK